MNKILFGILGLIFSGAVAVQAQNNNQDSTLMLTEDHSAQLMDQADSIRVTDSLEKVLLLRQLDEVHQADEEKKKEIQAKIDSINSAQAERDLRIKEQVDSLRANTKGIPVILFGQDTLFYIYSKLGPFGPAERAKSINAKLENLLDQGTYDPEKLLVYEAEESHDIMHEDIIILSITDRDAFWQDQPRKEVADDYLTRIKSGIESYQERTGTLQVMKRIGLLLLVIVLFFFGIKYMNKGFTRLNVWIIEKGKKHMNGVQFKDYEFLSVEQEIRMIRWFLKVGKWVIIGIVVYLVLPVILSIFPSTKGIASTLLGYVTNPIKQFGSNLVGYIPELITIIVIIIITRYILRFLRFLSTEIEEGKLKLPGFYQDWARPTYNIVKIIIIAFSFIAIFPYLPGSDSPVFQGVSVFLGIIFSLGSSSAINNIIAGLVITYMRPFKIGDRVKIGDATGDIIEKTMLVTRVRTIKNEEITIPNSAILSGNTINYSTSAQDLGLILNTTITIGYDVPWKKVHELLIGAALKAEHVQHDPSPFVFQTSLDDFYVSYQLNAYTAEAGKGAKIYSDIHSNIQDAFNEAGIEILSPHYRAPRDGNPMAVPAEYLPKGYQSPPFKVKIEKEK